MDLQEEVDLIVEGIRYRFERSRRPGSVNEHAFQIDSDGRNRREGGRAGRRSGLESALVRVGDTDLDHGLLALTGWLLRSHHRRNATAAQGGKRPATLRTSGPTARPKDSIFTTVAKRTRTDPLDSVPRYGWQTGAGEQRTRTERAPHDRDSRCAGRGGRRNDPILRTEGAHRPPPSKGPGGSAHTPLRRSNASRSSAKPRISVSRCTRSKISFRFGTKTARPARTCSVGRKPRSPTSMRGSPPSRACGDPWPH